MVFAGASRTRRERTLIVRHPRQGQVLDRARLGTGTAAPRRRARRPVGAPHCVGSVTFMALLVAVQQQSGEYPIARRGGDLLSRGRSLIYQWLQSGGQSFAARSLVWQWFSHGTGGPGHTPDGVDPRRSVQPPSRRHRRRRWRHRPVAAGRICYGVEARGPGQGPARRAVRGGARVRSRPAATLPRQRVQAPRPAGRSTAAPSRRVPAASGPQDERPEPGQPPGLLIRRNEDED